MKTAMILAAALALTSAPALAQTQQNAPSTQAQTQAQQPSVQTVSVVDVSELPAESHWRRSPQIEEQRFYDQDFAEFSPVTIEASSGCWFSALVNVSATALLDCCACHLYQVNGDLSISVTRKDKF